MDKVLLPDEKGYKANLHCHSTGSDGKLTAKELKEYYMAHGYSILAYTDHSYMEDRSSLTDENFVALNGMEIALNDTKTSGIMTNVYHVNLYSPSPSKVSYFGIAKEDYWFHREGRTDHQIKSQNPDKLANGYSSPEFSVANLNKIVREAKKAGYLAIYNHPVWSVNHAQNWQGLKGFLGMEIFNYGCYVEGYEEDNGYIYDDMLRHGQKIYCFATDDNHNIPGYPCDSFGGCNIMFPEKLTYDCVFENIKNGRFYSSTGARLRGLSIRDGKLTVGTENAAYIRLITNGRCAGIKFAEDKPLTGATFDIPDEVKYFRITVKDTNGRKAYTNAYFLDDLRK